MTETITVAITVLPTLAPGIAMQGYRLEPDIGLEGTGQHRAPYVLIGARGGRYHFWQNVHDEGLMYVLNRGMKVTRIAGKTWFRVVDGILKGVA